MSRGARRERITADLSADGNAVIEKVMSVKECVAFAVLERDDFKRTRLSRSRLLFYRSIFPKSGVHFSDLALGLARC